jgi:hypothetical protein
LVRTQTIKQAAENTCSEGTEIAGMHRDNAVMVARSLYLDSFFPPGQRTIKGLLA